MKTLQQQHADYLAMQADYTAWLEAMLVNAEESDAWNAAEANELRAVLREFYAAPERPYTDVWHYRTVNTYPGKHLCEKPLDMMRDIITISSRPGALVLDPFVGSGNSLRAAKELGRRYVGCDMDRSWAERAARYCASPVYAQLDLFEGVA